MKGIFQKAAAFSLKALLVGVLCLAYYLLKDSKFKEIDYFARDALQYLNSTDKVDKTLATLTLNILTDDIVYPHRFSNIKKIIDTLQTYEPKNIIIMMEPLDFSFKDGEKRQMFDYLSSQKNVFLNMSDAREDSATFYKDDIFKNYKNTITFNRCSDEPVLLQNRRATLAMEPHPEVTLISEIKNLGYSPKPVEYYKYSFKWWNANLAYIKNYPLGTYGNYQSRDLFAGKISNSAFKDKTVIIGTNDLYSFLGSRSTFSILNNNRDLDQNKYQIPAADTLANILNFHITGNYVKYLEKINDLLIVILLLCILTVAPLSLQNKIYVFLFILPLIVLTEIALYLFDSFYIDFSRTIALLVLIQYFALPFVMLSIYKKQEEKRLHDINDARIDALLSLSEKVAHDIRSPLGAINLILSRTKFDNIEHRDIVTNAIQRINSSAENILKKYKYQDNAQIDSFEKVNITYLLKKLIDEKLILDNTISYVLDLKADESIHALGYIIELERVISNILDNSIFALRNKQNNRQIKISTNTTNNEFILEFFDNGAGIPANILKLLGYKQITTKSKNQGHGIGLLHAKRTIERMNGSLLIESNENEFSRVIIRLQLTS